MNDNLTGPSSSRVKLARGLTSCPALPDRLHPTVEGCTEVLSDPRMKREMVKPECGRGQIFKSQCCVEKDHGVGASSPCAVSGPRSVSPRTASFSARFDRNGNGTGSGLPPCTSSILINLSSGGSHVVRQNEDRGKKLKSVDDRVPSAYVDHDGGLTVCSQNRVPAPTKNVNRISSNRSPGRNRGPSYDNNQTGILSDIDNGKAVLLPGDRVTFKSVERNREPPYDIQARVPSYSDDESIVPSSSRTAVPSQIAEWNKRGRSYQSQIRILTNSDNENKVPSSQTSVQLVSVDCADSCSLVPAESDNSHHRECSDQPHRSRDRCRKGDRISDGDGEHFEGDVTATTIWSEGSTQSGVLCGQSGLQVNFSCYEWVSE